MDISGEDIFKSTHISEGFEAPDERSTYEYMILLDSAWVTGT